jgi:exopolyphosphatase/guanosine-5'-triphosphate,3'-diphosphate pyrophosphatase
MKTVASIDIGSQTIRLMVAKVNSSGDFSPVYMERFIARLGKGLNENKLLSPASMNQALKCIVNFVNKTREFDVAEIYPVATACVREADNARQFLKMVFDSTGIMPVVLSGRQEAILSLKGVQSILQPGYNTSIVIDIGGGSTELILTDDRSVSMAESLSLGVIGLSEKYLKHDPPLSEEINSLKRNVSDILKSQSNILNKTKNIPVLIGTAGTMTTLAAMDLKITSYEPHKINSHVLSRTIIENLLRTLILNKSRKRHLMPGLEKGREVVIIPGAIIALTIMESVNCSEIIVSDAGLLEGVIIDKICQKI